MNWTDRTNRLKKYIPATLSGKSSYRQEMPVNFETTPTPTPSVTPTSTPVSSLAVTPSVTPTKTPNPTPSVTPTKTPSNSAPPPPPPPPPDMPQNFTDMGTVQCNQSSDAGMFGLAVRRKTVNLGPNTGTVTLNYNAQSVPDRFVVFFDGQKVIDTGFRGDPYYDFELGLYGFPPTSGWGLGSATFQKNTSTQEAYVYIYAPLPGTGWYFTLGCPS